MKKSPHRGVLALAVGALLFSSSLVSGRSSAPIVPVPQTAFSPLGEMESPQTPSPSATPLVTVSVSLVPQPPTGEPPLRERVQLQLTPGPPPAVQQQPEQVVTVQPKQTPSTSLSGHATWYCSSTSRCTVGHPGGLYAAIRRDLLYLRGQQVVVTSGSRSVTVTVIDCNCGANANLIDLYSDAFVRLAPLSRGRIPVTLHIP